MTIITDIVCLTQLLDYHFNCYEQNTVTWHQCLCQCVVFSNKRKLNIIETF